MLYPIPVAKTSNATKAARTYQKMIEWNPFSCRPLINFDLIPHLHVHRASLLFLQGTCDTVFHMRDGIITKNPSK